MRKCGGWALVGSQAGVPAVLLVWCLTMEPRWTGMLLGHPCVKWTHWHPWVFERQVHLRGVRTFAYPVKNTDTMVWVVGLEFMGSVLFGGPSHLGFMRWLSRWTYESLSWRCTHTHPHPPTHTPPHPHTHTPFFPESSSALCVLLLSESIICVLLHFKHISFLLSLSLENVRALR